MSQHRSFLVHRERQQPSVGDAGAPIDGGDAADFANDDGSSMIVGGGDDDGARTYDAVGHPHIGDDLPIHRLLQPQDLASRVTDRMTGCHHHLQLLHPMNCCWPIPSLKWIASKDYIYTSSADVTLLLLLLL